MKLPRQIAQLVLTYRKQSAAFFMVIMLLLLSTIFPGGHVHASLLTSSSIQMSDSRPSGTSVSYTVTFTFPGTTAIKCIDVIFADTTAHITLTANPATTIPTGLSTTSATKGTITGGGLTDANWSLYNTTNGILQLEYSTGGASTATSVTIPISGITNTSSGTFYAQIATYSTLTTHTCSGLVDNSNVMALVTTSGVAASVSVDPSVSLSVADYGSAVNSSGSTGLATTTSTTIPFGTVAAGSTKSGSQTLTVSTNAAHGYNLYVRYTGALTDSNSDTITDTTGTNGSPAAFTANTFGYTTDGPGATQFTSNTWAKLTTTNAAIGTRTSAQSSDATHIEYKVGISATQPPGTYTTTVIYTATPTF